MTVLDASQWLDVLLLGGFAGMMGQVLRVVVGLKKAGEAASARGATLGEDLEPWRLVVSLVIGGAAGAVAALTTLDLADTKASMQQVMAFLAAGYAGADFIEGFVSKLGAAPPVAAAVAAAGLPAAPVAVPRNDDPVG